MRDQELVNAIRRLKVETGSLACMGCGHEHNCGVSGCAVMREAADRIANQSTHIAALQMEIEKLRGDLKLHRCATCDFWRENDPRCMNGQSQWGGKTVPKDNYCRYWEHHTDWIPVEECLPELQSWGASEVVLGLIKSENAPSLNKLHNLTICVYCDNGIWSMPGRYVAITHWMPLPEPPEVEDT